MSIEEVLQSQEIIKDKIVSQESSIEQFTDVRDIQLGQNYIQAPNRENNQLDSMALMATDSPLKSAIRANSTYKIREFEWFEVETKIRLFVQKLMEPTLAQVFEDRKVVDSIQSSVRLNNDSVDFLKEIVLNQGAGVPIFEEFNKRIFEADLKIEQERRKTTQEISMLKSEIDRISFEGKQLQEQCRQIELTKNQLIDEFAEVKRQNLEFRDQMTTTIQNLSAELTANFSWARQQMQKTEERFNLLDITLQEHQNQMINDEKKIQDLRQLSLEFTQKHQSHLTRFDKDEIQIVQLQDMLGTTRKLQGHVQQLQNSISTLDSYVSTYQPLYIQGQISESLFQTMPPNQLSKLALYETKKFEEIHKTILADEGGGRVSSKINEYTSFMEVITKRNSKLVQQHKVKQSTANNLDENQDDNDNEEISKPDNSQSDDVDSVSQSKNSQSTSTIQREKTKMSQRKGGGGGGGSLSAAEVHHYEDLLGSVKMQLFEDTREFKQKIELTVKDVYAQIKEIDEQIFMSNLQTQDEQERKSGQLIQQLQMEKDIQQQMRNTIQTIENQQSQCQQSLKHIEMIVQSILHYLVLVTHLLIQDEIDRQGIALMGVKDNNIDDIPTGHQQNIQLPQIKQNGKNQNGNRILNIKQDCLSCSSHPLTTVTAFKLACLAYHPSDISVDGKVFKRDQLLEVCTKVLWAARKEMNEVIKHIIKQTQVQSMISPNASDLNRGILRKESSKRLGSLSVDSKGAPLTNTHLTSNYPQLQQQGLILNKPSTPQSINQSKITPSTRLNMINMNQQTDIQQPKVGKRQHQAYRTQKKLQNLNISLYNTNDQAN